MVHDNRADATGLGSLSLATALGGRTAASATGCEATTTVALEAPASLASGTITAAAAGASTASTVAIGTVVAAAALFDDDLLAANLVRVGGDGGGITGGLSEFNEGAVLQDMVSIMKIKSKGIQDIPSGG